MNDAVDTDPKSRQETIFTEKCKEKGEAGAQPLKIVYEDFHLAIVVKPQGLAVMGATPCLHRDRRLEALTHPLGTEGRCSKPRPCHRLDSLTGGLVVIARTKEGERSMKMLFAAGGKIRKRYRAIVHGRVENDEGTIRQPLGGKDAETRYKVVKRNRCLVTGCVRRLSAEGDDERWMTTIDLVPVTGRTHQLRRHCLKGLGHPIWGDPRHGGIPRVEGAMTDISPRKSESMPNNLGEDDLKAAYKTEHGTETACRLYGKMYLWALELEFDHPVTGAKVHATLEEPVEYEKLREEMKKRWIEESAP